MKNLLFALLGLLLTAALHAQAPQLMSYQAIIRNSNNQLVVNSPVGMRISILQGSANGSTVYSERHAPTTNANGLAMIAVGGGTALSGAFASINWANGPYFIKTETDPAGGSNYAITATSQLLSVPYALHSSTSDKSGNGLPPGGVQGQVITYCDGVPTWTNAGLCPGKITSLDCGAANNNGTLTASLAASGVSSSIPYTGGNGGVYAAQSINSTGVTGLTAALSAGTFANDVGSLTFAISGTPSGSGIASFVINVGGQACTLFRTVVQLPGVISDLDCAAATNDGILKQGITASGVSSSIPYMGGNGGVYAAQSISSTGVTGLMATLSAGTLAMGSDNLTYNIIGLPSGSGTASFELSIGGQACTLSVDVQPTYAEGSVHCGSGVPTAVVNVTNPTTGKLWMDRNLGAEGVASFSNDYYSYGSPFQWGRRADGHQCRSSATTSTLSTSDKPAHGSFIIGLSDWLSPQNDNLWQGVSGLNNPCPLTFRVPTSAELDAERLSWSSDSPMGAFGSPLKLPLADTRLSINGSYGGNNQGFYWSSTVNGVNVFCLRFGSSGWSSYASMINMNRANGCSVRCIKD